VFGVDLGLESEVGNLKAGTVLVGDPSRVEWGGDSRAK
jgi:hypothetical protein